MSTAETTQPDLVSRSSGLVIPTDEQIAAIESPEKLPGFLDSGVLKGLVLAIRSKQVWRPELNEKAVIIGYQDPDFNPKDQKRLLATTKPDLEELEHAEEGEKIKGRIRITSNLDQGLHLVLSLDPDTFEFDQAGTVAASYVDYTLKYYLKRGEGSPIGNVQTVGFVIKAAMPVILGNVSE